MHMRTRIRIVLALAILAALAAAWIGTTLLRASAALDAQKVRVTQDIAALRSRLLAVQETYRRTEIHRRTLEGIRTEAQGGDSDDLKWLRPVLAPTGFKGANSVLESWCDSGKFFPYEEDSAILGVFGRWFEVEFSTPRRILISLGLHAEFGRGLGTWTFRQGTEGVLLLQWQVALGTQTHSKDELGRMAEGLERLWETRLSLFDEFAAEYARFSSGMIRSAEDSSFHGMASLGGLHPDWKHLYSRTLQATARLRELEEDLRTLAAIEALPLRERPAAIPKDWSNRPASDYPELRAWDRCTQDCRLQTSWILARVATAVARYQADLGKFPSALEELVPGYLAAVPASPGSGRPLSYRDGRVSTEGTDGSPSELWVIRPSGN